MKYDFHMQGKTRGVVYMYAVHASFFFPHSEAFQISKGKIFRLDEVKHKQIQTMYVMHHIQCHLHHPQRFRMISTIPEQQFFMVPIHRPISRNPPDIAIIEGSLEVKLPTLWTVEKQR